MPVLVASSASVPTQAQPTNQTTPYTQRGVFTRTHTCGRVRMRGCTQDTCTLPSTWSITPSIRCSASVCSGAGGWVGGRVRGRRVSLRWVGT
jgi:hypothetical protein